MVTIVGVDPGLADTGLGVVSGWNAQVSAFAFGSVHTKAGVPLPDRLDRIYTQVSALLDEQKPDLMVVEDMFSLKQYPKSGITLGKVAGVILLAASQKRLPVMEIPVREAKRVLTGNGAAGKAQLERSVRRLLSINDPIRPFHASDALALAIIGLYRYADPCPIQPQSAPAVP